MKKILLVAAIAALSSTSVLAADLGTRTYTKAPAPAPVYAPVYNWTGFYIGAHIGGAWNGNDSFETEGFAPGDVRASNNRGAFLGGGQIGADYQFAPNWLIGVEGQISGMSDSDRRFALAGVDVIRDRSDWLASVTGRLGYTWGPGLLYVKGGVGFRDNNGLTALNGFPGPGATFAVDRKQTGYTVGGGLEYMFAPAWSGKIEYQYYNFDRTTLVGEDGRGNPFGLRFRDDIHTVKAGINYHFNWGGPVVGGY